MGDDEVSTEQDDATTEETPAAPLLRVVNPDATPEEIAALVAVFAALGGDEPAPERPAPAWQARHRTVRQSLPHGPGGWRSSGLPR